MIQDYPRSESPLWKLLGGELLAWTGAGLLYPTGMSSPSQRTLRKKDQRTIVLIHGYLANRSGFFPLKTYLQTQGIKTVEFNYASSNGIEQGAIHLKHFLRQHVRGGKIDLVCHSMGGLVARLYLQELDGARRVDRCITLGTPHHGTYSAYWVRSRVGRELLPDSPLLQRLEASKEKASNVTFTSIVAGADNIVIPRVFAANEETLHVPNIGHMSLLFSLKTFRMIADHLKKR